MNHLRAPLSFVSISMAILPSLQGGGAAGREGDPAHPNAPAARPAWALDIEDRGAPDRIVDIELPDEAPLPDVEPLDAVAPIDGAGPKRTGDPFSLGFAAGSWTPSEGERIDPTLLAAAAALDNGRPERVVYGFVVFARRITDARLATLEALGCRLLGFHPEYAWKAAIPAEAIDAVAALPFVRWVGCARPQQKVHPSLTRAIASSDRAAIQPVWIAVFESDLGEPSLSTPVGTGHVRNADGSKRTVEAVHSPVRVWQSRGWQQRALEARGVEVELYEPAVRAFRARVKGSSVAEIAQLDFVHAIEAVIPSTPADGPSASMVSADVARAWGYTGQSGALAGIVDSGLYIDHEAFAGTYAWGWDVSSNPDSPWIPSDFHGTMAAGGILADPPGANGQYRGYAPKLGSAANQRFRVVEAFETTLTQSALLGFMQGDLNDGQGNISPPVHVSNHSYGAGAGTSGWKGTEVDAVAVDAAVWNANQVVVFAAHNFGPGAGSVSIQGSSKNGLTVGNVPNYFQGADPGEISNDSGRGPTADGRWKPNVCAPGNGTVTCSHVNPTGYTYGGGTSMAAPHVTGLVAQLADHYSWLRYAPARVASLLMATATTRNNVNLTTPGTTHHNTYGAGRVDAFRAHFMADGQMTTSNWGFSLSANQGSSSDFTVEADVTRLVVCLHWIEAPPSVGASKAVVNNLDLYIDAPPTLDSALNTGEYVAQQSTVDNTEIRYITNPTPGTWRWKVYPQSAPAASRVSVTVHKVKAAVSPAISLSAVPSKAFVKVNETVDIVATVSNPAFVASAVFLDTTGTTFGNLVASTSPQKDGPISDLQKCLHSTPANVGYDVTLGSVVHDDPRAATFQVRWTNEGVKSWTVQARADNVSAKNATAVVTVDSTPPGLATGLGSSTHVPNVWSKNTNIVYTWGAASDDLSGVDGYALKDAAFETSPGFVKNFGAFTSWSQTLAPETPSWYLTIRTVDKSGNWSSGYAKAGPYKIDAVAPSAPSGLASTSHVVGAWSSNLQITTAWNASTDATSGVQGYVVLYDESPGTVPGSGPIQPGTTNTVTLPYGSLTWYAHVRAVDNAGNLGPAVHAGPFSIDPSPPTGTLTIDGGAAATTTGLVTLWIQFTDALSAPKDMRFKNDGGTFSAWQPFTFVKQNWSLFADGGSTQTGTRRVLVEVRDFAGNVGSAAASIYYHLPITYFGGACAGSAGMPQFSLQGLPGLGQSMTCQVSNTAASHAYVGWGESKTSLAGLPLPMDLGFLGSPGCQLFISFDGAVADGPPGTFGFAVPSAPALVGHTFYLQAVLTGDPSGKPLVATAAAELTIAGF